MPKVLCTFSYIRSYTTTLPVQFRDHLWCALIMTRLAYGLEQVEVGTVFTMITPDVSIGVEKNLLND